MPASKITSNIFVKIRVFARRSTLLMMILFLSACDASHFVEDMKKSFFLAAAELRFYFQKSVEKKKPEALATFAGQNSQSSYYFLMANWFSENEKPEQALVFLEKALLADPHSAYLHFAIGQQYLRQGKVDEGREKLQKSLELDPQLYDSKLLLANLYATSKQFAEATKLYNEILLKTPNNEEVIVYLSLVEIEQRKFSQARARLTKFTQDSEDSALAWFYLGRLEYEANRDKEAKHAFEKAIDDRPGFVQAGVYLARLQEKMGDQSGAIETYSWLANQTDSAIYHKKLGHYYMDVKNYRKALEAFQNHERVDPTDLPNKVKIGLILIELKEYVDASRKFEELLKQSPESENIRFYLGSVYEQLSSLDKALKHYEKITEKSPLFTDALVRRLYILSKTERVKQADKLYFQVLDKNESNAELTTADLERTYETGVSYFSSQQRWNDVFAVLDRSLVKLPVSDSLLYIRGISYEKKGDTASAIKIMQSLIEKSQHVGALNFVGYVWADKGENLKQAHAYIQKASQLRPQDPYIRDSLGWVLHKMGRHQEAYKVLLVAFAMKPSESIVAEHLGDVLVKLGRIGDARTYYELALRLGPEKETDKVNIERKISLLPARKETSYGTSESLCRWDAGFHCVDSSRMSRGGVHNDQQRAPASLTNEN